jgi:hypothetical protein
MVIVIAVVALAVDLTGSHHKTNNPGVPASALAHTATGTTEPATVPPTTVPPTTVPPPPTPAQYEASCTNSPAYGALSSPNAAQGTCVNYQAQVDVTNDGYGFWSNVVELQLPPSAVAQNFIENDVIQFWGITTGTDTYTTKIGGTDTVPVVDVKYATLVTAASS